MTKKGAFKSKGREILKPNSMSSFLSGKPEADTESEPEETIDVPKLDEIHKPGDTHLHKSIDEVIRQDFELRKSIVKRLETEKIQRRIDGRPGASKRAIVEEALEKLLG